MDPSDDQSNGEFDDSDYDLRWYERKTGVLLKKEPGAWIARNPGRLSEVLCLKLELPDDVYSISDSIGDLLKLQELIIKRGINLNYLPHTLPTLLNLVSLQLENCPNLSQFPFNFGNLVALRFLTIQNCGIKFLPQSLSLIDLAHLALNNCVFIQELPASLHVETLKLVGCHVESFSAKPRYLRTLEINNCLYVNDILTSLNHFDSLHTLQHLEIEDCINLKRLPQNLSQLAYLTLINCGLECIPSGLRSLTSLLIKNCPMEFLDIKESVSLIYVTIKSCNIKSLDGCITGLTKLKRLSIQDCVALEDLPTDINTLVSLETLCIEGCTSIKFLPRLAALNNLSELSLKGCSRLDELPADLERLTKLESLNLTDTNVQSLPSTIAKLPDLKYVHLPWCFRLETLPNDFDLKGIQIFLPLSFRLDTLPAKFLVTTIYFSYQLHLKDQKESSLELIHDKECDVDVADKSDEYWQTMLNTPPNVTHLPQPRPGSHDHHVEGRDCDRDVVAGKVVAQIDSNTDARNLVDEQVLAGTPGYLDEGRSSLQSAFLDFDDIIRILHSEGRDCDRDLVAGKVVAQLDSNADARNLVGGHGNQLEERDGDRHVAGKIAAQSDSNIDARNFVGETINHASENEQLGITTSGCKDGLEPLDHRDLQNVPVKSKRQKGDIPLEDIQQCISRNMTLVNAAKYLDVARSTLKRRLKQLKIEWPSSRKGKQNHPSKKKRNHNPKSTFVSEFLERSSVDRSDRPVQAHASECSDVANQIMLPEFASIDFGTNVIGETSSCITLNTVEDGHTNAFSLGNQGCTHHLSQESGGPSSMTHNKSDKRLFTDLIKSLMAEGISQEAAAERLSVSVATLKRHTEHHACGMWPSKKTTKFSTELASGSKSIRLDSAAISSAGHQEHTQHLHASTIKIFERETNPTQRLDPITMVRDDGDTRNATHDQICQDNQECTETSSAEAQDGRANKLVVKAKYKKDTIRFDFLSTSSLAKLKEEVLLRLPLRESKMKIKYQDEDKEWVLLACYKDLQHCLRLSMLSESKTIRLIVES